MNFLIEHLDSITSGNVKWKEIEKKTLSQKEKDAVRTILEDTSRFYCYEPEYFDVFLTDFHFIDIDGDNDFDIVYNGRECPGHESETIHVYINHKGIYKLSLWHRGSVLSFKNKEFVLYQYPCCAAIENIYSIYTTQKDTVILNYDIAFYTLPSNPPGEGYCYSNNLKKSQEIHINKNITLSLFAQGAETYSRYSNEKNCIIQTTQFIKTNSYSQFVDESGKSWHYTLVNRKDVDIEDKYIAKYAPEYLMLWVELE